MGIEYRIRELADEYDIPEESLYEMWEENKHLGDDEVIIETIENKVKKWHEYIINELIILEAEKKLNLR